MGARNPEAKTEFERVARELGCDETEEAFERIFAQIVSPVAAGDTQPPKAKPTKGARKPPKARA